MAYSKSRTRLEAMLPHLALLQMGKECAWTVEPGRDPERVAYRIREALHIARLYPKEYPDLAVAHGSFIIKVEPGRVVARRAPLPEFVALPEELTQESLDLPTANPLEVAGDLNKHMLRGDQELLGRKTVEQVIAKWEASTKNKPIHFPEAMMDDLALAQLYVWCEAQVPQLMILTAGRAVTLGILDPNVAEFAWRPNNAPIIQPNDPKEARDASVSSGTVEPPSAAG